VLAAGLPREDHVYSTTDKSFRFHNKKFDELRCKLDSTENPRSFEKYPTPPKSDTDVFGALAVWRQNIKK